MINPVAAKGLFLAFLGQKVQNGVNFLKNIISHDNYPLRSFSLAYFDILTHLLLLKQSQPCRGLFFFILYTLDRIAIKICILE